jgi:hypothetical protein
MGQRVNLQNKTSTLSFQKETQHESSYSTKNGGGEQQSYRQSSNHYSDISLIVPFHKESCEGNIYFVV